MNPIIVAFSGENTRLRILHLLASEGLDDAAVCSSGADVLRKVQQMESTVVISGFRLPDMTADALAHDLRGFALLLVIAKPTYLELCGGENLYKLPAPISKPDFFATIHMLLDASHPRRPASKRNGEDQILIHRAKALLMDVNRMSEEEAHAFLRRRAMDSSVKLADAALWVLNSYQL